MSCLQPHLGVDGSPGRAKPPKHKLPSRAYLLYKRLHTKATYLKSKCIYICINLYVQMYLYIYVCVYIFMYVHIIAGTQALSKTPNCDLFLPQQHLIIILRTRISPSFPRADERQTLPPAKSGRSRSTCSSSWFLAHCFSLPILAYKHVVL